MKRILLCVLLATAHAATINGVWSDGGTFSGSFQIDGVGLTSADIVTSASPGVFGTLYTDGTRWGFDTVLHWSVSSAPYAGGYTTLVLDSDTGSELILISRGAWLLPLDPYGWLPGTREEDWLGHMRYLLSPSPIGGTEAIAAGDTPESSTGLLIIAGLLVILVRKNKSMKILLVLAFSSLAFAQAATPNLTLTGPAVATPGSTVIVTASLTGTAGNISALQETLTSTLAFPLVGITTPSTLVTKSIVCAGANLVSPGPYNCMTIGILPAPVNGTIDPASVFNSMPIPDGSAVQTVTFTIPAAAAPNSTVTLTANNVFAAASDGTFVAIAGSSATIKVIDTRTAASLAFAAWYQAQTPANFIALSKAIAAVQQ